MRNLARSLLFALLLAINLPAAGQMPELKPLKGTPALSEAKDKDHFVFIVAGDNRPPASKDPQVPTVHRIFKDIQSKRVPFVLWTGDTIFGKDPEEPKVIKAQYKEFLKIAGSGGAAVFNAPGNHEMASHDNCPSKPMETLYLENTNQTHTYGAFTYGNSRFIALNSDDDEGSPPAECDCSKQPSGTKPPGFISKAQRELLEQDLKANKDKAHIFIFMHRPIEGYKGEDQLCAKNVTDLKDLFKDFPNISYVVAGHQHMYYNPQGKDEFGPPADRTDPSQPPYYLVSGGAGAPLKKKGFYHYLVFTVNADKVSVQVVPLEENLHANN
ncbi:MAG TPA: metallophosphoesterase [Candidatus Sulfotelmatobacter sp.]